MAGGPGMKKVPWTSIEDVILEQCVKKHGRGIGMLPRSSQDYLWGGKSCCLRWTNHLRPNIKRGDIAQEEENLMLSSILRWEIIGLTLLNL